MNIGMNPLFYYANPYFRLTSFFSKIMLNKMEKCFLTLTMQYSDTVGLKFIGHILILTRIEDRMIYFSFREKQSFVLLYLQQPKDRKQQNG